MAVPGIPVADLLSLKRACSLRLYSDEATGTYVGFKAPGLVNANMEYTLPTQPPDQNGWVLASTNTGVMTWVAQTGGGGATADNIYVNDAPSLNANFKDTNEILFAHGTVPDPNTIKASIAPNSILNSKMAAVLFPNIKGIQVTEDHATGSNCYPAYVKGTDSGQAFFTTNQIIINPAAGTLALNNLVLNTAFQLLPGRTPNFVLTSDANGVGTWKSVPTAVTASGGVEIGQAGKTGQGRQTLVLDFNLAPYGNAVTCEVTIAGFKNVGVSYKAYGQKRRGVWFHTAASTSQWAESGEPLWVVDTGNLLPAITVAVNGSLLRVTIVGDTDSLADTDWAASIRMTGTGMFTP